MSKSDGNREAPEFYLVQVGSGEDRYYVVCEPTIIIKAGEGWAGIAPDEIERYVELNRVPAAPLPGTPIHKIIKHTGAGR